MSISNRLRKVKSMVKQVRPQRVNPGNSPGDERIRRLLDWEPAGVVHRGQTCQSRSRHQQAGCKGATDFYDMPFFTWQNGSVHVRGVRGGNKPLN